MKSKSAIFLLISIFLIGSAYGLTGTQVFNKVSKSVVEVGTLKEKDLSKLKKNLVSYASAVAVKHNIVATNCHVALTGKYIIVVKNKRYSYASIIAVNKLQDICLLKIHNLVLVPVKLRPSQDLSLGEDVYAIGNPHGHENYLSKGIISKIEHHKRNIWIMTDTTTSKGSSGGGLFDSEGNLIAITTSIDKTNPNISRSAAVDWIIQKLNLRPVFKKNLPDKKPSLPSKASENTHGFQLIGKYGDNNIGLYRYKGGCFIYLPGRKVSGLITSAALWFPENRRLIFIYPSSRNINRVITSHLNNRNKNTAHDKEFKKTKHKLSLEKKYYDLYSFGKYGFTESILLVAFDENPTMIFVAGDQFVVYIADQNVKDGYRIRVFGLWGFSKALVNYNARCLNKPGP